MKDLNESFELRGQTERLDRHFVPGVPFNMSTNSLSHYQSYYRYYISYIFTSIFTSILYFYYYYNYYRQREGGREREMLYILYIYCICRFIYGERGFGNSIPSVR